MAKIIGLRLLPCDLCFSQEIATAGSGIMVLTRFIWQQIPVFIDSAWLAGGIGEMQGPGRGRKSVLHSTRSQIHPTGRAPTSDWSIHRFITSNDRLFGCPIIYTDMNSQYYFAHSDPNNAWHNNAHPLTGTPCLTIIAINGRLRYFSCVWTENLDWNFSSIDNLYKTFCKPVRTECYYCRVQIARVYCIRIDSGIIVMLLSDDVRIRTSRHRIWMDLYGYNILFLWDGHMWFT